MILFYSGYFFSSSIHWNVNICIKVYICIGVCVFACVCMCVSGVVGGLWEVSNSPLAGVQHNSDGGFGLALSNASSLPLLAARSGKYSLDSKRP